MDLFLRERVGWGVMEHLPGLILGFAGLAILIAVAWYTLGKIRRGGKTEASITANEQLSLFGRIYEQGELTKEEYRAIKSALAETISLEAERIAAAKEDEAASRAAKLEELLNGRLR